jgi:hypothetical protein
MHHSKYQVSFEGDNFQSLVLSTRDCLRSLKAHIEFDALAFTGISGQSIGFPVCFLEDIPMIVVRKETSHTDLDIESNTQKPISSYLILDDFIQNGNTILHIQEVMKEYYPEAKCNGFVWYSNLLRDKDYNYFSLNKKYEIFYHRKKSRNDQIPIFYVFQHHIPLGCVGLT